MKRVGRGWSVVGLHFYGGIVWRPGPCDLNQSKVGPLFRPLPTSRLGLKTKAGFLRLVRLESGSVWIRFYSVVELMVKTCAAIGARH